MPLGPEEISAVLQHLVDHWRFYFRCLRAYLFPMSFANWVNRERVFIAIHNNPGGQWQVRIGFPQGPKLHYHPTFRKAMLDAYLCCAYDPEFRFTSDYLRTLKTNESTCNRSN